MKSTYLSWSQSGVYQESIRSLPGVHTLYQESIRSIRTPDGLHQDSWGSVTYRGFGAIAATADSNSSVVTTPSIKQTSAPASAASLSRMMASSMPNTCAESVQPMMTKSKLPGSESRAMTAARIRVTNSSRDTTCLPCYHQSITQLRNESLRESKVIYGTGLLCTAESGAASEDCCHPQCVNEPVGSHDLMQLVYSSSTLSRFKM
jgi:hypothetical protein